MSNNIPAGGQPPQGDMAITGETSSNTMPSDEKPTASEKRAVLTNAHVLKRTQRGSAGAGNDHDDDDSEDDGPSPEIIENDEDLMDDYPKDVEDVELVHLRIGSILALKLGRFCNIKKLCLRQNHITEICGLDHLATTLVELDVYDNAIGHVHGLEHLVNLENLDLSFNKLKHIKRVNHLKKLRNLYFVQNRISRIEGLEGLRNLKNLELGANRIREIENLDGLESLEELWLGKNKITELKNLAPLTHLRILSIQSNRLTSLRGLSDVPSLEELYISHNAITTLLDGFTHNTKLRVLDISNNRITKLTGLKHLSNLEELWASSNGLSSFEEIERELRDKENLETVYFEGNPLQKELGATYRNKVRLALPQIKQIDATYVRT